ncbi:MAG: DUF420 domain-containing protein [Gammaproteobacteria bacterium]|nr:DUF420 domain-containing protein [Gammaproteobacteria bacterium]
MQNYSSLFLNISFIWGLFALGLLLVAWQAARLGKIGHHRLLMGFLTVAAWLFVAAYSLRYRYPGYVPEIPEEYIPWMAIHGTIALIPLFGATALLWARIKERHSPAQLQRGHLNRHHRLYGRIIVGLWCFTHLGGIANSWLLH